VYDGAHRKRETDRADFRAFGRLRYFARSDDPAESDRAGQQASDREASGNTFAANERGSA